MIAILISTIKKVIDTSGESMDGFKIKLKELQQQLLKKANSKQSYDKLAQEIHKLNEKKQSVLMESAEKKGF